MFNFPFEDIFESNNEIYNSYENNQIEKKQNIQLLKIKIQSILDNLKKAKTINSHLQSKCLENYSKYDNRLNQIEKLLEKVKRISKSKPKKHIKYSSYIPLDHIYFYTPKKIHIIAIATIIHILCLILFSLVISQNFFFIFFFFL